MLNRLNQIVGFVVMGLLWLSSGLELSAQSRYATSDNQSGYVHWIELYDATNTPVDPKAENPKPYSPERTCGRCHDIDTISHGWHFNAVNSQSNPGRPGQPWIWSDPRTGTHLPLSYRDWEGTFNPDQLGISRWEVAAKFGGFLPGGGPGASESLQDQAVQAGVAEHRGTELPQDRSAITGALPIDCLLCHRNAGSGYSPFAWTEQVEDQNFAYAPTVAAGFALVDGTMARIKELDPAAPDASKLPKVTYDQSRFRSDGKVFIDLVRKPQNNSCYYCHTNVLADSPTGTRWLHDEDVHLRAGLACSDCHRNSLDHHTVRGFEEEQHQAGSSIASLSCRGCHLGGRNAEDSLAQAGRLGAPLPEHRGLPPVHFKKLTCTACHAGPNPQQQTPRLINSITHRLGEHIKRSGQEFPAIVGPINLPIGQTQDASHLGELTYTPHRLFWPSYWGTMDQGRVTPLNPDYVYELIRKPLKVKRDFTEELADAPLTLTQRKELLGDDRARVKDEDRTPEERTKVLQAEKIVRQKQIDERLMAALLAIEENRPGKQAVFVTAGTGWIRYGEKVKKLTGVELGAAAEPYAWPMAHNVRPARQSLGVNGCTECHSDGSLFFNADIEPVSLLPEQSIEPKKAHEFQQADMDRLRNWNKLFAGRSSFKIASLVAFGVTCLIALAAFAANLTAYWQKKA